MVLGVLCSVILYCFSVQALHKPAAEQCLMRLRAFPTPEASCNCLGDGDWPLDPHEILLHPQDAEELRVPAFGYLSINHDNSNFIPAISNRLRGATASIRNKRLARSSTQSTRQEGVGRRRRDGKDSKRDKEDREKEVHITFCRAIPDDSLEKGETRAPAWLMRAAGVHPGQHMCVSRTTQPNISDSVESSTMAGARLTPCNARVELSRASPTPDGFRGREKAVQQDSHQSRNITTLVPNPQVSLDTRVAKAVARRMRGCMVRTGSLVTAEVLGELIFLQVVAVKPVAGDSIDDSFSSLATEFTRVSADTSTQGLHEPSAASPRSDVVHVPSANLGTSAALPNDTMAVSAVANRAFTQARTHVVTSNTDVAFVQPELNVAGPDKASRSDLAPRHRALLDTRCKERQEVWERRAPGLETALGELHSLILLSIGGVANLGVGRTRANHDSNGTDEHAHVEEAENEVSILPGGCSRDGKHSDRSPRPPPSPRPLPALSTPAAAATTVVNVENNIGDSVDPGRDRDIGGGGGGSGEQGSIDVIRKDGSNHDAERHHIRDGDHDNATLLRWSDVLPTGIILCGPSGVGKTLALELLSKDLRERYSVHIMRLFGPQILAGFSRGDGSSGKMSRSQGILDVSLAEARTHVPSVLVLDELDVLFDSVGDEAQTATPLQEGARACTAFLQFLDNASRVQGLTVLGATRRSPARTGGAAWAGSDDGGGSSGDRGAMPAAFRKPGRFDRCVSVGPPTQAERVRILAILLQAVVEPIGVGNARWELEPLVGTTHTSVAGQGVHDRAVQSDNVVEHRAGTGATAVLKLEGAKGGRNLLDQGTHDDKQRLANGAREVDHSGDEYVDGSESRRAMDADDPLSAVAEWAKRLGAITPGMVGGDLERLIRTAQTRAVRRTSQAVQAVLERAQSRPHEQQQQPKKKGSTCNVFMWRDAMVAVASTVPRSLQGLDVGSSGEIGGADLTWNSVGGFSTAKRRLQRLVQWPWQHPEAFARMGISAPAGALLYGPSGCGKSLVAQVLATECLANFVWVRSSELLSRYDA